MHRSTPVQCFGTTVKAPLDPLRYSHSDWDGALLVIRCEFVCFHILFRKLFLILLPCLHYLQLLANVSDTFSDVLSGTFRKRLLIFHTYFLRVLRHFHCLQMFLTLFRNRLLILLTSFFHVLHRFQLFASVLDTFSDVYSDAWFSE